ncbi:ArsR/SmtB family transcription factor [Streptomyces gamaensis]|uniref:ArsR/SmtB family transcription factor n=1 Tax=Streptomyces gamaensis TaxID=1763542 RepID=A0ABW0Z6V4_9ACTN
MTDTADDADDMAAVGMFRALGHPVRLGIMRALAAAPETCACDFTELFDVTQPTISQHLKVLREAGLVVTRRRGVQICYSVRPGALTGLQGLLAEIQPPQLARVG